MSDEIIAEGASVPEHAQTRELKETIEYPTHVQRGAESDEFEANKRAIIAAGNGCWICGGTAESTGAPLEGHHYNVEWALINSLDLSKVQKYFPDVTDLQTFLDSKENLIILCAKHHRAPEYGVHTVTMPAWVAQRLQLDGWDLTKGQVSTAALAPLVETDEWYPAH